MPNLDDLSPIGSPSSVSGSEYRPVRLYQTNTDGLMTFGDAVSHVLDAFDAKRNSSYSFRQAQRAVIGAYREFPLLHEWGHYQRRGMIRTVPPFMDGTIEFRLNGDYQRELILTGAEWPESVDGCWVRIHSMNYLVDRRISDTVLVLHQAFSPNKDIAAGTSYVLFKDCYLLPADFRVGSEFVEAVPGSGRRWPQYLTPGAMTPVVDTGPQFPQFYTIQGNPDSLFGTVVRFYPPPNGEYRYEFQYTATPRLVRPFGSSPEYTEGTIASISGNVVSGSDTGWTERMVGSVIRFADSELSPPSDVVGVGDDWVAYMEQRVIVAVESPTSIVVDSPLQFGTSYVGKKYSISDPVDIPLDVARETFLLLCEINYARLTNRDGQRDAPRKMEYQRKLSDSKWNDNRNRESAEVSYFTPVWPFDVQAFWS